ncbi:MAG: DUF305 domain-containing protein [Thermomicrobiales bacterium]|nr:DUF305 domain-containing protein [Thermomicrobiales bacterium]
MTDVDAQANESNRLSLPAWVPLVLGVLALVLGALALYLFVQGDDVPANDSADVGFVRDMSVHHTQAVEMANIVYRRTDDPDIARLARDIADTQQFQIGMMTGWLDIWGHTVSSEQPLMEWMGDHAMTLPPPPPGLDDDDSPAGMDASASPVAGDAETPLMPGMATTSEVKALETLPVDEMNAQFLRLMIRHHQGGVAMAHAELDLGNDDMVKNFAQQVVNTQDNEIATMTTMLNAITAGNDASDSTSLPDMATPVAATPEAHDEDH